MVVRGVRRSWDTARRRLARIRSFSLSALAALCCLTLVVSMPVSTAMVTMMTAEMRFLRTVKFRVK